MARNQLVQARKLRSPRLESHFRQTGILGALQLANEIFAQSLDVGRRILVLSSDMRQSTPELNQESSPATPSFLIAASLQYTLPALQHVQVDVLGADGVRKSSTYWESLEDFWTACSHSAGTDLHTYSV